MSSGLTWRFEPAFGPWLRDLRERDRYSLRQLAEAAEGSPTVMARLETGEKRKRPDEDYLRRIALRLGVDVDHFLRRAGFHDVVEPARPAPADTEWTRARLADLAAESARVIEQFVLGGGRVADL